MRPAGVLSATNLSRDTDLATSLEVAGSLWAKFMGLMGRATLAPGAGLWLPDSNGIHMMFMRFPIDAIFVGKAEAGGPGGGGPGGRGGGGPGARPGDGGPGGPGGGSRDHGDVRPVVSVHRGLRTWTGLVPLVRGAHGVLELPVGTIDASATRVGDRIRIG